ncbi:SIS domain-containing protein, partial [Francisella tularensis]|uniref:SIS domain-containing protein n=1 Tax=Francisella tularensis TaxID=263 RepID=UPI002381AB38
ITTIYGKNIGDKETLAISISQSGGSPDLRISLEGCKKAGCTTLAIVKVEKSPLAESAHLVLPVRADAENALVATKRVLTS